MPMSSRLTRLTAGSALLVALSVGTALPATAETTDPTSDTVTEAPSIAPLAVDPGTTDPGVTDPGTTDPGVTDPGTTDPGVTDPGVTDPGTTDPGVTDPSTAEPGTVRPGSTSSGQVEGTRSSASTSTTRSNERSGSTGPMLAETGGNTERAVLAGLMGGTLLFGGLAAVFAARARRGEAAGVENVA